MNLIVTILEQGLIYGILSLGLYITYKILDFPDLTVDGSFPLGAAVTAALITRGVNPYLTLPLAFAAGVLSGIVEPVGAVLTILAAAFIVPALPYLLSFAAGAMLYVVVEELIPEMSQGKHSDIGTVFFAVGFSVMMILDVALG